MPRYQEAFLEQRGFQSATAPIGIVIIAARERMRRKAAKYPEQSQPINFADKPQAPSLILAPEADTLVSTARNSVSLQASLQQNGNVSQLTTVPGTDHITLVGTLSPILFFKGNSTRPIQGFINNLYQARAK
jgi:hypothetical protein